MQLIHINFLFIANILPQASHKIEIELPDQPKDDIEDCPQPAKRPRTCNPGGYKKWAALSEKQKSNLLQPIYASIEEIAEKKDVPKKDIAELILKK